MARNFKDLLKQLEPYMKLNLSPDNIGACRFKIKNNLSIQIEFDYKTGFILICSELGEITPGRYKEDFFISALIANGKPYPRFGDLAYSDKKNCIVLFDFLSLEIMDGKNMYGYLVLFIEKAKKWKQALDNGDIPIYSETSEKNTESISNILGLQ